MEILKEEYKSFMKIKLSFKKYAEINNCQEDIRNRLEISHWPMRTFLSDYFGEKESLNVRKGKNYGFDSSGKERTFSIKPNQKKLSIDIKVSSTKILSPDELLNIKDLVTYIETGKNFCVTP